MYENKDSLSVIFAIFLQDPDFEWHLTDTGKDYIEKRRYRTIWIIK